MKFRARKQLAVAQGISFEQGLLPKAKKRAKARRRNLSAYICDLIHEDLSKAPNNSAVQPVKQEVVA